MSLGGLDVGSSGCKCTVFDERGAELASAYMAYPVMRNMGLHEMDVDAIWQAVRNVISQAAKTAKENGDELKALCVSSFGETCVVLDEHDKQAIPSFLYTDSRGASETKQLSDDFGGKNVFDISGHRPGSMYTLPKLMWSRKHMPDEYGKARKILPIHSTIIYLLTGETVTDPSLASRTMMFDIRTKQWHAGLMEYAGLDASVMPDPVGIGDIVGKVTKKIAGELGISEDLAIVIGAQD